MKHIRVGDFVLVGTASFLGDDPFGCNNWYIAKVLFTDADYFYVKPNNGTFLNFYRERIAIDRSDIMAIATTSDPLAKLHSDALAVIKSFESEIEAAQLALGAVRKRERAALSKLLGTDVR